MKNYLFRPLVFLLLFLSQASSAQTEQENHDKYWLYRHQLRERFMKIGTGPGESLPASVIIPGISYGTAENSKVMHWRDATISLGHYLIVLATEYRLLLEHGQETTTTENEIYYALKAALRLDQYCEHFTTGGAYGTDPGFVNGLMMRDDVPQDFYMNWENYTDEYPFIDLDIHDPSQIQSDFSFHQGYGSSATLMEYNEKNIQSIDQVVSLLLGLRFLIQLVENIDVQPIPSEPSINIHQTAKDIIWRLIARMNDTGSAESPHEWVIKHENGELVPRGNNAVMASYPLIKLLEYTHGEQVANFIEQPGKVILQISKEDYCESQGNNWFNTNTIGGCLGITLGNLIGPFVGAPFAGTDIAIYNNNTCNGVMNDLPIEGPMPIRLDIDDIAEIWHDFNDSYALATVNQTDPLVLINPDFDFEIQNIFNQWVSHEISPPLLVVEPTNAPKAFDQVNIHMLYELAVLSGIWTTDYLTLISQVSNLSSAAMMNAVLHNNRQLPVTFNISVLTDMLNCAPASGIWSDPFSLEVGCPMMASPNMLFLPDDATQGPAQAGVPDWEYRGLYPGLDYMVMYNLFRLLQSNSSNSQYSYHPNCQCRNVLPLNEIEFNTVEANPQFEDYFDKNLPIETFVNTSCTFTSSHADFQVNNDLIICSRDGEPVIISIEDGAKATIRPGRTITIRNNCILKLSEALLEIPSGLTSENATRIIVENGAQLIIESDSYVALHHSFKIENLGGEVLFENSNVTVSDESVQFSYISYAHGSMQWNQVTNADAIRFNVLAKEQSTILFDQCDLNLNFNGLVDEQTGVYFYNTNVNSVEGNLDFTNNSFLISENSSFNLVNTDWTFGMSSDFHSNDTEIAIIDGSSLTFKDNNTVGQSQWVYDNCQLVFDGDASEIILDGGKLFIASNSVFETIHPSGNAGILKALGDNSTQIVLEQGSSFRLIGESKDETMLELSPSHQLHFIGTGGEIIFENGTILMPQNATISTYSKMNTLSSRFQNNVVQDARILNYYGPLKMINSSFENVSTRSQHSKTSIESCTFSGPFSSFYQNYGSINCTGSQFQNSELHLHLLNTTSSVSKCIFNNNLSNVYQAIGDNSQIELYLSENQITGYQEGISKVFGKLSLRCNYISGSEIGIFASKCILNMSSSSNAGFNQLENNQTHIFCNQTTDLLLRRGFNQFGPFSTSCIEGTITKPCDTNCQQSTINASSNQWSGNINSGMFLETTGFLSSCNGQQCAVWFNDPTPVFAMVCANTKPSLKPNSRSESASNSPTNQSFSRSSNDWIYLEGYGEMPLDSALSIAAMTTEQFDSLGNDELAISLFHEILSSSIDLYHEENRAMVEWGVDYMKSALENMFHQNEIRPEQNRSAFENSVRKYVEVLNTITNGEVADTLVATQFYLELNKGHLFRLIQKPEIALSIYNNLLNCALDSIEMNSLSYWIAQVENEISIVESYGEGDMLSPNEIPSLPTNTPPVQEEDYKFGVYIHSPNSVSFVDCSQLEFVRNRDIRSHLFPNPSKDKVHINITLEEGDSFLIQVYDLAGRLVLENDRDLTVDVSSWESGTYILHAQYGEKEFKELFVVEH